MPLAAMLLSVILFKDTLQISQCIGSVLILLSMILIGSISSEDESDVPIELS
jgi:drug/metabolite transporter (DMT)-like permease